VKREHTQLAGLLVLLGVLLLLTVLRYWRVVFP
jgi:hypothetical protein